MTVASAEVVGDHVILTTEINGTQTRRVVLTFADVCVAAECLRDFARRATPVEIPALPAVAP